MSAGSSQPEGWLAASPRAVLVDLGRQSASGARRRAHSLMRVLGLAGFEVQLLEVLPRFRAPVWDSVRRLPAAMRSRSIVPETLAWSPAALRQEIQQLEPTVVVCITARCFHPLLLGPWRTYVDYVDRLSVSYRDRSRIATSSVKRLQYRVLAHPQQRFEAALPVGVHGAFAAGRADATSLGVDWLRISAEAEPLELDQLRPVEAQDTDVCFVGTLDYPPNVAAVLELEQLWPELTHLRPEASALIAGARPTREVRLAAQRQGWELQADFDSVADVFGRCRVSVAPLRHASGIQIKVLDAAAYAVPQVVSPVVAGGLDDDFPFVIADRRDEWASALHELLVDGDLARRLGEESRVHLDEHYSAVAVARDAVRILAPRNAAQ